MQMVLLDHGHTVSADDVVTRRLLPEHTFDDRELREAIERLAEQSGFPLG